MSSKIILAVLGLTLSSIVSSAPLESAVANGHKPIECGTYLFPEVPKVVTISPELKPLAYDAIKDFSKLPRMQNTNEWGWNSSPNKITIGMRVRYFGDGEGYGKDLLHIDPVGGARFLMQVLDQCPGGVGSAWDNQGNRWDIWGSTFLWDFE